MKLKKLIQGTNAHLRGPDVVVTGLSADSRKVVPGNLFFAKKGSAFDGALFIEEAVRVGAAAVVTDLYNPFLKCSQIICPDPARMEGVLAARFYQHPSKELFVAGVTGSKGKTTTSYLIKHLLDGLGKKAGLMGTVETIVGENRFWSALTTHDVITNQKLLREMVQKGCKAAVLEVSSHGLAQNRVDEIDFDVGIFTNLYPDHLDYHGCLEEYVKEKQKLFEKCERAIVNADCPYWKGRGLSFGMEEKADLFAKNLKIGPQGVEFDVDGVLFTSKLIGRFNVYNLLGAIAVGVCLGEKLETISQILKTFTRVPGRLEEAGGGVFVDFAHTGEALENVLRAMKEVAKGQVIVVFGCGGGRDPARREGMARAAEKFADQVIVTTDNPRQEDPNEIICQIVSACKKPVLVEPDRKKAIALAIQMAKPEDLVLIAGKGHEQGQVIGTRTIPFDDLLVAKEALQIFRNSAILYST